MLSMAPISGTVTTSDTSCVSSGWPGTMADSISLPSRFVSWVVQWMNVWMSLVGVNM